MSSEPNLRVATNLVGEIQPLLKLGIQNAWENVSTGMVQFPRRQFYRWDMIFFKEDVQFLFTWLNEISAAYEVMYQNFFFHFSCVLIHIPFLDHVGLHL